MNQRYRYGDVLSSLDEAALDDALWPAASARIDDACGMRGSTLVMARGHSQADGEILFARANNPSESSSDVLSFPVVSMH